MLPTAQSLNAKHEALGYAIPTCARCSFTRVKDLDYA